MIQGVLSCHLLHTPDLSPTALFLSPAVMNPFPLTVKRLKKDTSLHVTHFLLANEAIYLHF